MTKVVEVRYSGVFEKYVIDTRVYDEHFDNVLRTEVLLSLDEAMVVITQLQKLVEDNSVTVNLC